MATVTIDLEEFDALRAKAKELEDRIQEMHKMQAYIDKLRFNYVGIEKAINTAVDETVDLLDLYSSEYRDSVGVPMQKGIEDLKILLRQRFANYT